MLRAVPLLLALTACGLLTGPDSIVRAYHDPPHIVVENEGSRTIYYFAIEQRMAALVLWGPCDEPPACDGVAGGERREIPYEEIAGYSDEAEVVLVYWWHLVPRDSGGFKADSIRVEQVRL